MKAARTLLAIDSSVNLLLGALLVFFPKPLALALGIPVPASAFYPSILGGVLFGVGIALALEYWRPHERLGGLGLGGAIAINLCGGLVLAGWLIGGSMNVPIHGYVLMWALAGFLVIISAVELIVRARNEDDRSS
ncbi:MAG: hypothetical protein IH855_07570 [Bacteroidetes bacterium]|nr:hypothetical protein [Bacteroidota bacterium]